MNYNGTEGSFECNVEESKILASPLYTSFFPFVIEVSCFGFKHFVVSRYDEYQRIKFRFALTGHCFFFLEKACVT